MIARSIFATLITVASLTGAGQTVLAQQVSPNCGPFMSSGWHGWFIGPFFMLLFLAAAWPWSF